MGIAVCKECNGSGLSVDDNSQVIQCKNCNGTGKITIETPKREKIIDRIKILYIDAPYELKE